MTLVQTDKQRGQAVLLFAVLIPMMVLLMLGVIDYMVTNSRVMEAVAAADLAAHAGVQKAAVRPDGAILSMSGQASSAATIYFNAQKPAEAILGAVSCDLISDVPYCQVQATVPSAGYLIPTQLISVSAVGYLASGVTAGDQ